MPKRRPGDAHPIAVHVHLVTVAFGEEVCHQRDHVIGREALAAFHPLMRLQLEARQRGHDEEVAVEVGHRLLDEPDLESGVGLRAQQIIPHERLMEVGGHLCHKHRILRIDEGLRFPGEIGVHGVPQFMGQRAQAEDVVIVAHHDEGIGSGPAGGKGAGALALVGEHVHPAFLGAAATHRLHILRAHRREALANPLHGLFVGDGGQPGLLQRRPDVVGM